MAKDPWRLLNTQTGEMYRWDPHADDWRLQPRRRRSSVRPNAAGRRSRRRESLGDAVAVAVAIDPTCPLHGVIHQYPPDCQSGRLHQ